MFRNMRLHNLLCFLLGKIKQKHMINVINVDIKFLNINNYNGYSKI